MVEQCEHPTRLLWLTWPGTCCGRWGRSEHQREVTRTCSYGDQQQRVWLLFLSFYVSYLSCLYYWWHNSLQPDLFDKLYATILLFVNMSVKGVQILLNLGIRYQVLIWNRIIMFNPFQHQKNLDWLVPLVADPPPFNFTTYTDTHPLSYGQLNFGWMDKIRSIHR